MAKRSSYRLGRRLKASARDRLDWITYLQTVKHPAHGVPPEPPGPKNLKGQVDGEGNFTGAFHKYAYLAGQVDGGGALDGTLRIRHVVDGLINGGGDFAGHLFPPAALRGHIDGGGAFDGKLKVTKRLRGTIEGGGDLSGLMASRIDVFGTLDGGGDFSGKISSIKKLTGMIDGGGDLNGHLFPPAALRGTIDGGGDFAADLSITPQVVALKGTIDGGGAFSKKILRQITPAKPQTGFTKTAAAAGTTPVVIARPANANSAGALLIAVATVISTLSIIATPVGWTLLKQFGVTELGASTQVGFYVWYKYTSGSEPASYSFARPTSNPSSGGVAMAMYVFLGAHPTAALKYVSGSGYQGTGIANASPTAVAITVPNVNPAQLGVGLLGMLGTNNNVTSITPPTSAGNSQFIDTALGPDAETYTRTGQGASAGGFGTQTWGWTPTERVSALSLAVFPNILR